nr:uncharacterized protein LOC119159785 [Rhipicephalus microplus]
MYYFLPWPLPFALVVGAAMPLDRSPSRRGGSVVRRQRRLAAASASGENKCRSCCRKFAAFLFSHVGLCALVVGYSVLGAFAFRALEGPYEVRKASQVRALREQTVSRLWEVTAELNVLYKDNWTFAVNEHIRDFQLRLVAAVKDGYDGKESGREQQWSFSGAFLYSLTVITTIADGGRKWTRFRQQFEFFLQAMACQANPRSEAAKTALLLSVAGEEALDVFNNFVFSGEENKEDFSTVIAKFEDYCLEQQNEIHEQYVFRFRSQGEAEPFEQFLRELKKQAQHCNFGIMADDMVRDQIVFGTNSPRLREKMLRDLGKSNPLQGGGNISSSK